jgi:hypothetical protein
MAEQDVVATHPQRLAREVILGHQARFKMVLEEGADGRLKKAREIALFPR